MPRTSLHRSPPPWSPPRRRLPGRDAGCAYPPQTAGRSCSSLPPSLGNGADVSANAEGVKGLGGWSWVSAQLQRNSRSPVWATSAQRVATRRRAGEDRVALGLRERGEQRVRRLPDPLVAAAEHRDGPVGAG